MDTPVIPHGSATGQPRMNDIRESDIRVDPAYREKLQFFNDLNIKRIFLLNIMAFIPSVIPD